MENSTFAVNSNSPYEESKSDVVDWSEACQPQDQSLYNDLEEQKGDIHCAMGQKKPESRDSSVDSS